MIKSMPTALLLISCFTITATLPSCSKDKDDPVSKTQLLTQKAWKLDQSGPDIDKNGTIDLADEYEACELDNTYTFLADGTGISDEAATKCDPSDPQSGVFNWEYKNSETEIYLDLPALGISEDVIIKTINENTLEVYKDIPLTGFPTGVRYVLRLKH